MFYFPHVFKNVGVLLNSLEFFLLTKLSQTDVQNSTPQL